MIFVPGRQTHYSYASARPMTWNVVWKQTITGTLCIIKQCIILSSQPKMKETIVPECSTLINI